MKIDKKALESNTFIAFIKNESNNELYQKYLNDPSKENAKKLDAAYKTFEQIIIIGAYLKKVIYFEAKRFDQKIRKMEKMNVSIDKNDEEGTSLADVLTDKNDTEPSDKLEETLDEIFENEKLYAAIVNLTKKQQNVLYLLYIKNLSEKEVALMNGVSQQAISKTHRSCIKKLKEAMAE